MTDMRLRRRVRHCLWEGSVERIGRRQGEGRVSWVGAGVEETGVGVGTLHFFHLVFFTLFQTRERG